MRSIAERRKDGPLAHTAAAALQVVGLRHRAAAAASTFLTVDAAAAAAYCTPEGAAYRLGQQVVFCTTIAQIQGVLRKFFLTWFSAIVDYHFLTQNFFLPRVLPFVLTV